MLIRIWILAVTVSVLALSSAFAATKRHPAIGIVSAQTDLTGTPVDQALVCPRQAWPKEIVLKTGHVHEVSVTGPGKSFRWEVSDPTVADIRVDDSTDRIVRLTGKRLGNTQLTVKGTHGDHVDSTVITVRGVSRRYTVVAWIDRDLIDPESIAPNANEALKDILANPLLCYGQLALWYTGGRGPVQSSADVLYAKAFLVNKTSNDPPPVNLTEKFFQKTTAYKLWNDFQVNAGGVVVQRARIGETTLPCSFKPKATFGGEVHPENEKTEWNADRTMLSQINEARIGTAAQRIERAIDPKGPPTPWIWSILGFDIQGNTKIATQIFPTYSVYLDGTFCGNRVQDELARFVSMTTRSDVTRSDVARYQARDWSNPCTER